MKVSKSFFNNFNFQLYSRETYRKKYFDVLEKEEKEKVFKIFKNNPFSMYLDETIDSRGCKILNILGMCLSGKNEEILRLDSIEIDRASSEVILNELLFL